MEKLIKNLTQKDENIAMKAAKELLDSKNLDAFELLTQKSDFLFDFIKNNVCKRLYNAADKNNYLNVIEFFDIYDETYADVLVKILSKYSDFDISDQMLKLLEGGNENQKAYAARYFEVNFLDKAIELLKSSAFSDFQPLMENSIKALASVKDTSCHLDAYQFLKSNDSFDVLKGITYLTIYPDLSKIDDMIGAAINSSMPENAAAEIANAVDLYETVIQNQSENNLLLLNSIINGFGEILPLYQIIDYKIFDIVRALIDQSYEEENSQIAQILLNGYMKFKLFFENEEYTYDEDNQTKDEIKKLVLLFENQGENFWTSQKELIFEELFTNDKRCISALQIIGELNLDNNIDAIIELQNSNNELIICSMVETLAALNKIDLLDIGSVINNIKNKNLAAIIKNYSLTL